MNNQRRSVIKKAMKQLDEIKTNLEEVAADEEDARDNMPEGLIGSEKYDESEEASENLEDAVNALDEAIGALEEIIG